MAATSITATATAAATTATAAATTTTAAATTAAATTIAAATSAKADYSGRAWYGRAACTGRIQRIRAPAPCREHPAATAETNRIQPRCAKSRTPARIPEHGRSGRAEWAWRPLSWFQRRRVCLSAFFLSLVYIVDTCYHKITLYGRTFCD